MLRRQFINRINTLGAGVLAGSTLYSCANHGKSSSNKPLVGDAWQKVPEILSRINPPVFPDQNFNIMDYGAKADGVFNNRSAILKTIEACVQAGGGHVIIPAGDFLIKGPIYLKSNIDLHLEKNAVLRFGTNPQDYLVGPKETKGCVLVRWEGVWCYNYSPVIYAFEEENIAITGEGLIDGQTDKFWANWYIKKLHMPDRKRLYQFGLDMTPVKERIFGEGHHLAAGTIEFYHCKKILIEGITTRMPLERTIHPVFSKNITVRNINIQAGVLKARNDDGVDPDSCQDVLIENCTFHNYDDAIALKSGRAKEGWVENGGRPTQNVIIRNNMFYGEHNGVSTGSDMSGGIRNIFVYDCQFGVKNKQMYVFNAKSNCDRGGVVEDVYFKDLTVVKCDRLIRMEMEYKNVLYDPVKHPYPPLFRNIRMENVTCEEVEEIGFDLRGVEQSPIQNVVLKNIEIKKANESLKINHMSSIQMDNVMIGPKAEL